MDPLPHAGLDETIASRVFSFLRDAQKETQILLSAARHRGRGDEGVSLVHRLSEIQRLIDLLVEMVQSIVNKQIKEEEVDEIGSSPRLPSPVEDSASEPPGTNGLYNVSRGGFTGSDSDSTKETDNAEMPFSPFPREEDPVGEPASIRGSKSRRVEKKDYRTRSLCAKSFRTLKNHLTRHRERQRSPSFHRRPENAEQIPSPRENAVKKLFQCPHCDKMLKSRGCLDSHIKGIHGEKNLQCGHCGLKFGLQTQLNVHIARDHEGRSFPCEFKDCEKVYKTKNAMKSHLASFHEGIKHLCPLCGKAFSREESLISHRLYVHEAKGSVCKTCGKEFKRPESMHKHAARVHRGKSFPCHLCGKELATPKSRRDHVANIHRGEGGGGDNSEADVSPPLFTCDKCGKVKKTERGLKLHVASVHEGRKFPCLICGEEFYWHSLRRNHIRTVHEGVKFDCHICGKNFSQGSALKTHVDSVHHPKSEVVTASVVDVATTGSVGKYIHLNQFDQKLGLYDNMHNAFSV